MTIFVVIFLPLTVVLGFWQLSRASWKSQLLQHYQVLLSSAPVSLNKDCCELFSQVVVRGEPLAQWHYLVDNRTSRGQAGYEVVVPVRLSEGSFDYAWVSLGWIAGNPDRRLLPEIGHLPRTIEWQGTVRRVSWQESDPMTKVSTGYRRLLPGADRYRVFPELIQLNDAQPYVLTHIWQPSSIPPARHFGYAVQWFALALTLVLLYLKLGFKHPVEESRESQY
ncbi:SURF1 family protein [Gynuella sp.]|uniref:SURF1 family protein n=1 Tax=Gynuella sp. TaxID=2969146 RepID=UPI003D0A1006